MARLTVMARLSRSDRYDGLSRRRVSRRALLAASARAGVGAAGLALVGCGEDEPTAEPEPEPVEQQAEALAQASEQSQQSELEQTQEQVERVTPTEPVRGGILRVWFPVERHDRWDPHRSRYRTTQALHSVMYNRLLRPLSVATGELEPDLCSLPELPDESTYVFTVTPGAAFWSQSPADGRAFTAEDIRWNIERQQAAVDAEGAPDPHFFRQGAYERTAAIDVRGNDSITLSTAGPDATYLGSVHAAPFAWMTSPEAAEAWGDEWRDNAFNVEFNSGTGPYVPISFDGRELLLRRSDNWWRTNDAWPDGIVFGGGGEGSLVGTYSLRQVDFVDHPVPNEVVQALRNERPDDLIYELPIAAPVQLLTPHAEGSDSPLGDPRMVRALGLAVDRTRLVERLYVGEGRASGPLPAYLEGWSLPQDRLAEFPGYRAVRDADLEEIQQLVSAAGGVSGSGPIPFVTADLFEGFFAGSGEAVRAMLSDATGLEAELDYLPLPDALGRIAGGDRFLFLTWGDTPLTADPSDSWRSVLHSNGDRNWGGAPDPEIDALIDQMGVTFDLDARRNLAHQVQERLLSGEAPQWMVNLINGIQLGIAQPYVHFDPRVREFAWSWNRLADSWLDTGHEEYVSERALPEAEADEQAESESSAE